MAKNFFSNSKNFFARTFSLGKTKAGKNKQVCITTPITLVSVNRQRNMTDEERRSDATEQIDSYYGFSLPYLRWLIEDQINNKTIAIEMKRLVVALPLLKKFICSISKVYEQNPVRTFHIEDKQIVSELPSEISDKSRFIVNKELTAILESFYNKSVVSSIKEAEKLTNLLNTTIFKVITDDNGLIKIKFIPNDTIQICQNSIDPNIADELAFIRDDFSNDRTFLRNTRLLEQWTQDQKTIPVEKNGEVDNDNEVSVNEAAIESEKLFDSKRIGSIFAPFVVFRESDPGNTFWNLKEGDTFDYIKSINLSLTELRYLIRYASFGLKYVVNATMDKDSTADPTGFLSFQSASRTPGDSDNIQVGEFENKGRIKEVIESIIFNLKMLYDSYNLKLDSLISSNSISSAESKDKDDKELFAEVNSQRAIWAVHEEELFKVIQSVHNRDNSNTIPKGITIRVNYEEQKTQEKENEDWMVEVQNNISSVLDWISAENPDLTRKELQALYENNISINSLATESNENEFEEEEKDNPNKKEEKENARNNPKSK
jgi:hypothetical protein